MDKAELVPRTIIFNKIDDVFTTKNGQLIHSIGRLALALEAMSKEEFNHHVTTDKNDFAAWVSGSCGATELAQKMGAMKEQKELTYEVMKFVMNNIKMH